MLSFVNEQPKVTRIAGKNVFLQYEECQKLSLSEISDHLNSKLSSPYELKEFIIVSTSGKSKVFCYYMLTTKSKRVDTDPSFFNIKRKKPIGWNLADGYSGFCSHVVSELGDIEEELAFVGSENLFDLLTQVLNEKREEHQTELLTNKFLFEKNAEENYDQSTYYSSNICRSPTFSLSCSNVPSKPSSLSANSQQVYEETIRKLTRENQEKDAKYQILEKKYRTLESQLEDIFVCMKQLQSNHHILQNKMEFYEQKKK